MLAKLHHQLLKVEGALGAFFATLLTLGVGSFGVFWVQLMLEQKQPLPKVIAVAAAIALVWSILEVPFLWRVWSALRAGHVPAALYAAGAQPQRFLPIRVLVGAWWLAHFAIGLLFAWMAKGLTPAEPMPGLPILRMFIVLCYCYAANVYLMHGVVSLTRRPSIVEAIWRWRGGFDAALALLALLPVPTPNL